MADVLPTKLLWQAEGVGTLKHRLLMIGFGDELNVEWNFFHSSSGGCSSSSYVKKGQQTPARGRAHPVSCLLALMPTTDEPGTNGFDLDSS